VAALPLAVLNFVIEVIDEAGDRTVRSDGPNAPNSRGVEIQRIRVLPVKAVIIRDIFAIGADGHPASIVDVRHGGAVAMRLLSREFPALARIEGTHGNVVGPIWLLVIATHRQDFAVVKSKGENSRRRIAVSNRRFPDRPSMAPVLCMKHSGYRSARAEENLAVFVFGQRKASITGGKGAFIWQG